MDAKEITIHYGKIKKILYLVLVLNWGVAISKIMLGIFTRCASISADGFHSFADGTSNIIGIIGIHFACQPKDVDHPYGHRKYETFFSLGISVMLFILAFNIAKKGILRLGTNFTPEVNILSFSVMIITLLINIFVMSYEYKKGLMLKSDILTSDSMHTKADILTSVSVVFSLIFIKLGYPIADSIVTIIISLFIAHAAYEIMKNGSAILCDSAAMIDDKKIVDIVLGIKGVKTCHKIRTRGRPDDIHLDLHVQVNPNMHVDDAHEISYAIEGAIKNSLPQITDVIIHIEPKEQNCLNQRK
jgi:cation diffusion facilitator family transporter